MGARGGESRKELSGELVMGRFRLGERIGSGGMGIVYRAWDERLERSVAVKEIGIAGADRVLREAQAAARLNHPAIVTLYELGERDGHALLVSELVEGETLDELARKGSISDRDVGRIGTDLCDALAHAHGRGVIHRDIKPQNAIIKSPDSGGRRAKLMDFGIASVAGSPTLTAPGEVLGTLAYMAPEQAEGDAVGSATDVYALALTLYEVWAGENPVARRTPAQTVRQIGQPVPSLAEIRPDLPRALVGRIDACLDPEPEGRPKLESLRRSIAKATPDLDDQCAVPAPDDAEALVPPRSFSRVLVLAGSATGLAALAGPGARPGLALLAALLAIPALVLCRNPLHAALPLAAIPLGAVGALGACAALIALAGTRAAERAILGATAFATYLAAALAFKAGPRLGIAPAAPDGWERSVGDAATAVLAPLADPQALLGMAVVAVASVLLGFALRAHPAVALVLAMIWAAGMAAALGVVGSGAQGRNAALIVLAAGLAVAAASSRRNAGDSHHRKPAVDPGKTPALA